MEYPHSLAAAISQPDNLDRMADVIVGSAEFFNKDGSLVWVDPAGAVIQVNVANSRAILSQCIVSRRLVVRDGRGRVEYHPFAFERGANTDLGPDEKGLVELVTKKLLERAPLA